MNTLYYKTVENGHNVVTAKIHSCIDDEVRDWESFIGFLSSNASLEKRFKKAHAWADARLALMHEHTVLEAPVKQDDIVGHALWVMTEHNALHFGENHSTVLCGRAALEAMKP